MIVRRRFQPSLDSLSSRISPSQIGLLAPAISVAVPALSGPAHAHAHLGGVVAMNGVVTASMNPIIIAPIPSGSPTTLPC